MQLGTWNLRDGVLGGSWLFRLVLRGAIRVRMDDPVAEDIGIKKMHHTLVQKEGKRFQGWGPEDPDLRAKQRKTALEAKKQCPEK